MDGDAFVSEFDIGIDIVVCAVLGGVGEVARCAVLMVNTVSTREVTPDSRFSFVRLVVVVPAKVCQSDAFVTLDRDVLGADVVRLRGGVRFRDWP